jgi:uncharacterized protein
MSIGLPGRPNVEAVSRAGMVLDRAAGEFERCGYTLQSRRIAFDHWDLGFGALENSERAEILEIVDASCVEHRVDFCSIGLARQPAHIAQMGQILGETSRLNAGADIGGSGCGVSRPSISAASEVVLYLSTSTSDGLGNFRFGAGSCLEPGTPYFPGSYHDGRGTCFSIGLENSDLLVEAFTGAATLDVAEQRLEKLLAAWCREFSKAVETVASAIGVPFRGLDTSIAPSLKPEDSIVEAFDRLGIRFGGPGTLAACAAVTRAVKSLPISRVGYCGIMLPVLEDAGLAKGSGERRFGITDLLAYSSVCAVGVDMVPIPGDVPAADLDKLLLDVATVSVRLNKPLLARLLPVKGKRAGDATNFTSPYLCNAKVMAI